MLSGRAAAFCHEEAGIASVYACKCTTAMFAGQSESKESLGSAALALAWHPNGTRIGVSRKNGKFTLYDIRKLGSRARAVCEKTFTWELNSFAFWGDGSLLIASYGYKTHGGFKVLQVQIHNFNCCW